MDFGLNRLLFLGTNGCFPVCNPMHEVSIAQNIIEIVQGELAVHKATRLKTVHLKVGELTAVDADSLTFCFEALVKGTGLEGALLSIEKVEITSKCSVCGKIFPLEKYFHTPCPDCGGKGEGMLTGQELDVVRMEIE